MSKLPRYYDIYKSKLGIYVVLFFLYVYKIKHLSTTVLVHVSMIGLSTFCRSWATASLPCAVFSAAVCTTSEATCFVRCTMTACLICSAVWPATSEGFLATLCHATGQFMYYSKLASSTCSPLAVLFLLHAYMSTKDIDPRLGLMD